MKNKICCIGIFMLVLIITAVIAMAAILYGNSMLNFPTALAIFSLMLAGFILLLIGCRLWENHEEQKPSEQ
jgi:membrane protein implicated in regulation of membrane protease activity